MVREADFRISMHAWVNAANTTAILRQCSISWVPIDHGCAIVDLPELMRASRRRGVIITGLRHQLTFSGEEKGERHR